jgi:hypothetical protein
MIIQTRQRQKESIDKLAHNYILCGDTLFFRGRLSQCDLIYYTTGCGISIDTYHGKLHPSKPATLLILLGVCPRFRLLLWTFLFHFSADFVFEHGLIIFYSYFIFFGLFKSHRWPITGVENGLLI